MWSEVPGEQLASGSQPLVKQTLKHGVRYAWHVHLSAVIVRWKMGGRFVPLSKVLEVRSRYLVSTQNTIIPAIFAYLGVVDLGSLCKMSALRLGLLMKRQK